MLEEENVGVWDGGRVGALVVDWEDIYVEVLVEDCVDVLEYVSFR